MTTDQTTATLAIFPTTTAVDDRGHLVIGGCDLVDLAATYGTPYYLFDEQTLRGQARAFRQAFERRYPKTMVAYACKAYINPALARIFHEEGLGLDVVSGGEIAIARRTGFPMARVHFHGNNKTPAELRQALEAGIGRIVVDNDHELETLEQIAAERGVVADILVRVSPGVDPHTHEKTTTGITDSKFGLTIANGQAEAAIARARQMQHVRMHGIHAHLGSPIFELEPYALAVDVLLDFAAKMRDRHGLPLEEISPGGGFAIQYVRETPPPSPDDYAEAIVSALLEGLDAGGFGRPTLIVEPGRAIVGRAGVAVYTVGARKEIPGVRTYVSVDGGMADNIRPAIYGSRYEALVANRANAPAEERITLAGKFCESGDILIKDVDLPR
ncbi:MAG: diaminopimelate decarboxylase, partial [Chloroflexi bacterium]|nr:diaminopimelate decarboxylase [Chloroflexota bacterium]